MAGLGKKRWAGLLVALAGAVGLPFDDHVSAEGLTATNSRLLYQGAPGIPGTGAANEYFGYGLAAGDFDNNGYDDLVVGAGGDFGGAGSVTVVSHFSGGMSSSSTGTSPLFGIASYGSGVATGDFDNNGFDDLAVGGSIIDTNDCTISATWCSFIQVYSGTGDGDTMIEIPGEHGGFGFISGDFEGDGYDDLALRSMDGDGTIWIARGGPLVFDELPWEPDSQEVFYPGTLPVSLAAGDVDGDGTDELAVGFPGRTVNGQSGAGSVLLYDASYPISLLGQWNQDTAGIIGGSEPGDQFGYSVALGDTNGDGYDDLIAGVVGEDAAFTDMGAFHRIPGSASGLTEVGDQLYDAGSATEASARAGATVAVGNFEGTDQAEELAVAVPLKNIGGATDAGAVWIAFSGATNNYWHQDVSGIDDVAETNDHFGAIGGLIGLVFPGSMTVGDFNADGADDLAIGIPDEDLISGSNAGAVEVLFGTPAGPLDTDGDGCPDISEQQIAVGTELTGGRRDYLNPNDYFNPSHDGVNRVDDILLVVQAYFDDDSDGNPGLPPYAPGYNPDTDRTLVGPNAWNLGPPNGLQRVDDILNQVKQYFHDCS